MLATSYLEAGLKERDDRLIFGFGCAAACKRNFSSFTCPSEVGKELDLPFFSIGKEVTTEIGEVTFVVTLSLESDTGGDRTAIYKP